MGVHETQALTIIKEKFQQVIEEARWNGVDDVRLLEIVREGLSEQDKLDIIDDLVSHEGPSDCIPENYLVPGRAPPECIDDDSCMVIIAKNATKVDKKYLTTVGRTTIFDKIFANHPTCRSIRLPDECDKHFKTIIKIIKEDQDLQSILRESSMDRRAQLRAEFAYYGYDEFLIPTVIDRTEELVKYGVITRTPESGIFSPEVTPDGLYLKRGDPQLRNTLDWFEICFGRSRIIPERITLDVHHSGKFRVIILVPNDPDDLVEIPPPVDVSIKRKYSEDLEISKRWKILAQKYYLLDGVETVELEIPNIIPTATGKVAVVFVSTAIQLNLSLDLGRFEIYGRACLRL